MYNSIFMYLYIYINLSIYLSMYLYIYIYTVLRGRVDRGHGKPGLDRRARPRGQPSRLRVNGFGCRWLFKVTLNLE